MKWRIKQNHVDCAVFMMRHIETFMGESITKWECGLVEGGPEQKTQLENVRYKYLAKMMLSKINTRKDWVIKQMNEFAKFPPEKQKEILHHAKNTKEDRLNKYM